MSRRKLNVLVYTGVGTTAESVRHAIWSLRRLLSPNYAVIPISDTVLLNEPWEPTCALLVMPGGADLGYCRVLNGPGNAAITQYVRRGGSYLGFCAGGYYGSKRCEFEIGNRPMEVVGSRELAFFPGTCRGGAFQGFQYHSEAGARAAKVVVRREGFADSGIVPTEFKSYYNGGGVFVDAATLSSRGVEILATYGEETAVDGGDGGAAVVCCKVGNGLAMLTGPHPEFAPANLSPQPNIPGYEHLRNSLGEDDESRASFLRACLAKLGLEASKDNSEVPSLSKMHLSALNPSDVPELVFSWDDIITKEGGEEYLKGEMDMFHLEKPNSRWSVSGLEQALKGASISDGAKGSGQPKQKNGTVVEEVIDYAAIIKRIVSHEEKWPEFKETPYFNHNDFFHSIKDYRKREPEAEEWGNLLLYGEVVTSTNTLLEKNHKLLSKLPSGFTLAATTQIAGRGRGSNVWVSPAGCLVASTVINHPAHLAASRPVVFIQYLAAVAIADAIKTYDHGYGDVPVKLKWPNDIYVRDPSKPESAPPSYIKIGGILSKCTYAGGAYQVVLGIGLNTTNARPTTSLNALLTKGQEPYRIERLLARLLTRLEVLYKRFVRHGFTRELEERYYAHWLHTGQTVTLEAEGGVRARVVGITRDWGMLKAEELALGSDRPTGKTWVLQSDENSFDFWKGLVRRKV